MKFICLIQKRGFYILNNLTIIRGATLEAVMSRMNIIKMAAELSENVAKNMRIIAVSATIPNIHDIGEWLGVKRDKIKIFGNEYREIQLEKHVLGN